MGMAAASLIALGAGFLYWRSAQNKQALLAEPVTCDTYSYDVKAAPTSDVVLAQPDPIPMVFAHGPVIPSDVESVVAQHAVQKTTPLLTASAKSATTDMSGEKPREEERILVVTLGRGGGDILEMADVSRWWGEGV